MNAQQQSPPAACPVPLPSVHRYVPPDRRGGEASEANDAELHEILGLVEELGHQLAQANNERRVLAEELEALRHVGAPGAMPPEGVGVAPGPRPLSDAENVILGLLTRFREQCALGNGDRELFPTLNLLVKHADAHLTSEQRFLDGCAHPARHIHRREHELFLERLFLFNARVKKRGGRVGGRVPEEFLNFLTAWVRSHIEVKDEAVAPRPGAREAAKEGVLRVLTKLQIFRGLSDQEQEKVLEICHSHLFVDREVIFREGEASQELFVVLRGAIDILVEGARRVCTLKGNEILGEMGVFCHIPRTATAVARERSAVLRISRNDLECLVEREPKLGVVIQRNVIRFLTERLISSNEGRHH